METLFHYSKIIDENLIAVCSNFRNTTRQGISVLVKALGTLEDSAMLSKASFEVGRPEHVFNFSELLTRHEVEGNERNREIDNNKVNNTDNVNVISNKYSLDTKTETIDEINSTKTGNAITIMEKLKEEEESQKEKTPTGLSTFFNRWLRL